MPVLQYALQTAGQVLIDHGYPPEAAFIDLYMSGELEDLLHRAGREGLFPALRTMSLTSQYGLFSRLERFQDNRLATLMGLTLEDIRSGAFSRGLGQGAAGRLPRLLRLLRKHAGMELWELEQEALDLLYPDRERTPALSTCGHAVEPATESMDSLDILPAWRHSYAGQE